jgi:hypothetical protein
MSTEKLLLDILKRVRSVETSVKYLKRSSQDLQQSAAKRVFYCFCAEGFDPHPTCGRCLNCGNTFCDVCMSKCEICDSLLHARCLDMIGPYNERVCKECQIHCAECGEIFTIVDEDISVCFCCGYHQCRDCLDVHESRHRLVYLALALNCSSQILEAVRFALNKAHLEQREISNSEE